MKEKISVVIPCYNSEKSIGIVINKTVDTFNANPDYDYEIILVNDCSPDNTWGVISELAMNNPHITAINFSKNFGQHCAIMAAFHEVTGDYVVGMDDDGEHDPTQMFLLIDELKKGHDYVCAKYEETRSAFRGFGTMMNNKMAETLIDKPKGVNFTSFYAIRRFVIDEMIRYEQPYPYIAGLLLRTTHNISSVPMERGKRLYGSSGYNLSKMISLWINGFTAFSVKPLRVASIFGIGFAFLGFIYGIVTIIRKLILPNVQLGYSSLMAALMLIGGMIMLMLGLIGEYIGRMYISINNSPQYVIKEKIKIDEKEGNDNDNV